eukprot:5266908-Amphidinium_carterae.1
MNFDENLKVVSDVREGVMSRNYLEPEDLRGTEEHSGILTSLRSLHGNGKFALDTSQQLSNKTPT